MAITDRVRQAVAEHAARAADSSELTQFRDFALKMKEAGLAAPRTYDLPLPDTLGCPAVGRIGVRAASAPPDRAAGRPEVPQELS